MTECAMRMPRLCRRFALSLSLLTLLTISLSSNALVSGDRPEKPNKYANQAPSYLKDIQPIFQTKCSRCHGAKVHRADLDLSTPVGILKGGESGTVIVAGQPDKSHLYEKVHSGKMPPGMKDRLSEQEVDSIKRWIAAGAKFGPVADTTTETALTQHDVIPILLRRCTTCHGLRRQEAGLDLRDKALMLKGGKSGPAIVLGKPEESLLIKKARAGQMPPRERLVEVSVKPIESAEIETLAKWIAVGAPEVDVAPDVATTTPDSLVSDRDREFWAFQAPRPVAVPKVGNTAGVRNPI